MYSAVASCARTFNVATVDLSASTNTRTLCLSRVIQSLIASSLESDAIVVAASERRVTNSGAWTGGSSGPVPSLAVSSHARSRRCATAVGHQYATCLRTSGAVDCGSTPSGYPPSGGGSSLPCSHARFKNRTASVLASTVHPGVRRMRTTHSHPAILCVVVLTTAGLVFGFSASLASNDTAASFAAVESQWHRSSANVSTLSSIILGQSSGSLANTASRPAAAPCAGGSAANFGEHTVAAASNAPAVTTSSLRAPFRATACVQSCVRACVLSIKTGPLPLLPFLAMSTRPPMFCWCNPKFGRGRIDVSGQGCGVRSEWRWIGGLTWVSAK